MSKTREQLEALADEDLCEVFIAARAILKNRRLLDRVQRIISKEAPREILSQNRKIIRQLNPFIRGQVRRDTKSSYLIDLLKEDWSTLFVGTYDEEPRYYVYYHSNPKFGKTVFTCDGVEFSFRGKPFYIGKGCGDRYRSKARSRSHLSVLNRIEIDYPATDIYHIFQDGLTEIQALALEAKLITFFGCESEISKNHVHLHGFHGGWLINSDPAIRPPELSKLIKVRGVSNKD